MNFWSTSTLKIPFWGKTANLLWKNLSFAPDSIHLDKIKLKSDVST
jgi:hypothetical protein